MEIRLGRLGIGLALVLALAASMAGAPLSEAADKGAIVTVVGRGPLDGMNFVGKIGSADNMDLDDELHFCCGAVLVQELRCLRL